MANNPWFANENYKNTYYNQLLNSMGGQNNLMWALLDKAKYKLIGVNAPKTKIDVVIGSLKNKFGESVPNINFESIFGNANYVNNGYIDDIKFNL